MKQITAPIISNSEVMPETHLIWLEAPAIAAEARPGQFVMVNCGENCYLPRPLSIHRTDGGKLALLFKIVGKGTEWLSQQKTGNTLNIFGPLGNGYAIYPESKNLLLVAGGIGIAPLAFLAETAASRGCAVHLHQGVNTAGQILLEALLLPHYTGVPLSDRPAEATQYASPGTGVSSASTVDGSAGVMGMATICVPGLATWADQIFACGPVGMYRAMAQMPELKIKPVQVSLEMRMACGVGVCYSCTIKTRNGLKQVCKDGPVFNLEDIIWEEMGGV